MARSKIPDRLTNKFSLLSPLQHSCTLQSRRQNGVGVELKRISGYFRWIQRGFKFIICLNNINESSTELDFEFQWYKQKFGFYSMDP